MDLLRKALSAYARVALSAKAALTSAAGKAGPAEDTAKGRLILKAREAAWAEIGVMMACKGLRKAPGVSPMCHIAALPPRR